MGSVGVILDGGAELACSANQTACRSSPWTDSRGEPGQTHDEAGLQVAHNRCGLRGSLQRFGEFLGWCHPSEGLSRPPVELVGGEVEVGLGECCHVGAFGEVLAQETVGVLVGTALPG